MTCCICLQEMKDNHIIKKLSCNHKMHYVCFRDYSINHGSIFVNCPLCRNMNYDNEYPYKDNYEKNIRIMCSSGVGKINCVCQTKKGLKCKNKSLLMNNGKCYIHNKNILSKDKYELFYRYLNYLFTTHYRWSSMIYLIDIGKKIIIKYLNKDSKLEDILFYISRFKNDQKINLNNMLEIYNYYNLEKPETKWIDYCIDRKKII